VVTCGACGATNAGGARFCSRCGSALGAACPSCGAPVEADARFCSNCGATLVPQVAAGEERKLVTVLFADVTGSTTLGEHLDPERLRDILRTYFDAMREEIQAEGGTVEKFIGDAVMAAFGVPAAHEDDPARALRAAGRMLRRLDGVNERLASEHGVTLEIRIGVNTGEVLATTDPQPGEPMVTGDAVNSAARLQAAAAPGEVVASERTVRAVRGWRAEDIGPLQLKGRVEPVRAFRILGEPEVPPERGVPGLSAPMVGREPELDLLASLFERVRREGRPNLVTVYGDAGVGKSRLTREFLDRIGLDGPVVLRGRCLPYGNGVTFWPLAEILKAQAGILDTDPPEIALERIRKAGRDLLTEELAPDPARAMAAMAFTVGVEDPDFPFASTDPKTVRAEVHAAWRSFFSALSTGTPVVVVVEDIHWADPALLDLLEEMAERVVGPVLFLCPARPELTARRPDWGGGRRNHTAVALDPLTGEESERLIGLLLAIDDLPAAVRGRILERAEGNPFFLEEIVRHLIDEGVVVREAGRWRAAAGIEDVDIPDTVQAVLAARIDLLEPADKRVLQAAAVVGRVFWPGPVQELVARADVTDTIEALESRELVLSRLGSSMAGQPEYLFKHILTRDVAYESLPKRERGQAHATVAAWIERTAGARSREFVELLAYHYATAVAESPGADEDLRRTAFEHLVAASADSRSKQVLKKAERFAEDALGLATTDLERAVALEALGDAFLTDYDGNPAWRTLREAALTRARAEPPDPRKVAYLAARAVEVPVRWPGSMRTSPPEDEVRAILDLGFAHLPEGESEERARLLAHRAGWPFAFPGTVDERELGSAEETGIEAAEMALRLALPDIASAAFDAAVGPSIAIGRYDLALDVWRRRAELVPRLRDVLELGDLCASGAWFHCELGRYAEARRILDEGLPRVTGLGANAEVHALSWLVVTLGRLGEWDEALVRFERLRDLLGDRRDKPPYFATHAYAAAGMIHEARSERLESDRLADLLLALGETFSSRLYGALARFLVERGEVDGATAYFARRPASWRVHSAEVFEARCELVATTGAWGEAPDAAREARAHAEFGVEVMTPVADRLEGRAAIDGEPARAFDILRRASEGFSELSMPHEEARTRLDLAEALSAAGTAHVAAGELDAAEATFERLGATKDEVAVRAHRAARGR